ncbi:MAG TPA: SDR family oxidoreductase [Candidatus Competibacter sp.]|nr:short-chain dehydrogenase [Candidatus Competibacteraceae bacterium]HUM95187.1 SDR family oxidoreductase [Candidatus Competibacter sp.]
MRNILIVGATSAIAEATARRFAALGARFYLVGRNAEKLAAIVGDLEIRGGQAVHSESIDLDWLEQHPALLARAVQALGGIDLALIAHGSLPDQAACQKSVKMTLAAIQTNALSVISLATELANLFEARGRGTLVVIGSVAGDRGRQSNYVYGAAKGMVGLFLQGLRNRLNDKGVHVITVKPGFVDTPMTAAFEKKGLLWAQPDQIARGIVAAVERRRDVVYLPGFWRWIMIVIRHLPESIFKRLKL